MRTVIAFLLLCSSAFAADVTFTARTGTETGIQPALEAWKADETARNGGTLPNWWLWSVVAWDQNNDGLKDILVGSHQKWGSTLLRQTGPLTFTDVTTQLIADKRLMPHEYRPSILDVDKDGFVDLIQYSNSTEPLLRNTGTSLVISENTKGISRRHGTFLDFDSNGFMDAEMRAKGFGLVTVYRNRNKAGDTPPVFGFEFSSYLEPYPEGLPADLVAELDALKLNTELGNSGAGPVFQSVDLDGDGDLDLICQRYGSYAGVTHRFGRYCIRNAEGVLENKTATIGIPPNLVPMIPARDVTGDGITDIFITFGTGAGLYMGSSNGTFSLVVNTPLTNLLKSNSGSYLPTVEYYDFNNDGKIDILASMMRLGQLGVFENQGGGTFVQRIASKHYDAEGWDVADIDNDGDLDVLVGGPAFTEAWNPGKQTSCQFTIYLNMGVYSPPSPPKRGKLRIVVNGTETPGTTITDDGVEVPQPTGEADRIFEIMIPENPQSSLQLQHPLDSSDTTTVAGARFLKAALTGKAFDAALAYKLTGDKRYSDRASSLVTAQVAADLELIASGKSPSIGTGSYYSTGEITKGWLFTAAWCELPADTKASAESLIRQAVANLREPTKSPAPWGKPNWGLNDPGNNYFYHHHSAVIYWSIYSGEPDTLAFARERWDKLAGYFSGWNGGSREGTNYGVAQRELFELADVWKLATGGNSGIDAHRLASVDYWMHASTPDGKYLAPIGDQPRVGNAPRYDYDRQLVLLAGDTQVSRYYLIQYPKMAQTVNCAWDMLPVAGEASAPNATSYEAPAAGHYFARSDWTPDASYVVLQCGPFDQAHQAQSVGAFDFWGKGVWLANTQNTRTTTGIQQTTDYHNMVRFEHDGKIVPQLKKRAGTCSVTDDGYTWVAKCDLSPLYDGVTWKRTLTFQRPHTLTVDDMTAGADAIWQLQLPVEPTIARGVITAGNLRCRIAGEPSVLGWAAVAKNKFGWRVGVRGVKFSAVMEIAG